MKQIKYINLIILAAFLFIACNKQIEEKQQNPNNPTSVPPNLILGTVLTDMSGTATSLNTGSSFATLGPINSGGINSWDNAHAWNQYHCQNYDYYGNNIYSWANGSYDPYLVMKNVIKMDSEWTSRGGEPINAYEAV